MQSSRFLVFSLLAWGIALTAPCPRASAHPSVLVAPRSDMQVHFSVSEGTDLFIALRVLTDNAPALMDLEVIHRADQSLNRIVPGFFIASEDYTLPQILTLLKTGLPEMTWTQDANAYHVVVVLDNTVADALDDRTIQDAKGTKRVDEWLDWLRTQHPDTGICSSRGGIIAGMVRSRNFDMTALDIQKGVTFREMLNAISGVIHTNWYADVKDKPFPIVEIRKDGSFEFTPPDPLDHPYGASIEDYYGKTSIDFSARMSVTEGLIRSPVPTKNTTE